MTIVREREKFHKVRIDALQPPALTRIKKKKNVARKKSAEHLFALKKDLLSRLQNLRVIARDITSSYLANLERDILEVIDHLNGADEGGKRIKKLNARTMKSMAKKLDRLSLKPEKGRRKDIKRIERIVDTILAIVER